MRRVRPLGRRLFKIAVKLVYVMRVRFEAARRAYPSLDLDKRAQSDEVNSLGRAAGRRGFLIHLLGLREPCGHEEIADSAGDIRLRLVAVVDDRATQRRLPDSAGRLGRGERS